MYPILVPRVNFYSGPIDVLPPEVVREFIASQICPWCKRGPFKLLASHVNSAHGVDRHALKEMALMFDTEPACDPQLSEKRRDFNLQRWEADSLFRENLQPRSGYKRRVNTAFRILQKQKVLSVPEKQRHINAVKAGKSVSLETLIMARKRSGDVNRGVRCAHGTRRRYAVWKCRCAECVEASRSYNRAYWLKNSEKRKT